MKNNLTDEGLSILLGYLANDDTTQVLNLTSNQLTSKSLDLFIEVGMKNSLLKTIYLSHNKIASLAIKQRANEFSNLGIELIVWFFTLSSKRNKNEYLNFVLLLKNMNLTLNSDTQFDKLFIFDTT